MTIKQPEPLSKDRIHSPAEIRSWESANADYYQSLRDEEKRKEEQERKRNQPKYLSDEEYYSLAKKEEEKKKGLAAKKEKEEEKERKQKEKFLASNPEVVKICETNAFTLVNLLQHWFSKGYQLDNLEYWQPMCYALTLKKPTKS